MRMVLTTDKTFLFGPTVLAECLKLCQLKHCVTKTEDQNSSTLCTIPVTWQTKIFRNEGFCFGRVFSVLGLISSRKIGRTLPSFLIFLSVQPWRK